MNLDQIALRYLITGTLDHVGIASLHLVDGREHEARWIALHDSLFDMDAQEADGTEVQSSKTGTPDCGEMRVFKRYPCGGQAVRRTFFTADWIRYVEVRQRGTAMQCIAIHVDRATGDAVRYNINWLISRAA